MDGGRGGKGGGCGGTHTQSAMSTLEILGGNHDSVCLPPPPQRAAFTCLQSAGLGDEEEAGGVTRGEGGGGAGGGRPGGFRPGLTPSGGHSVSNAV